MPLSHAALILSAHLVLAADEVPRLDYEGTCRAQLPAADQGKGLEREQSRRARSQLEQHGAILAGQSGSAGLLGAAPSYVELITCLENARDTNLDADRTPVTTTPPLRRP